MGFVDAIKSGFANYVNFSGRAARSEFWFWMLFSFLANLVAGIIDAVLGTAFIGLIASLALLPQASRSRRAACTISTAPDGGCSSLSPASA